MIGLDTNLLVRLLTGDDPVQCRRAAEILDHAEADHEECFVSNIVLCELEWVLESAYGAKRADITAAVTGLLGRPLFVFQSRKLIANALSSYAAGRADLSDFLMGSVAREQGARTTWTFDRTAAKGPDFSLA